MLVYFRASAGDPKHNHPDKMVTFGLLGNMFLHITNNLSLINFLKQLIPTRKILFVKKYASKKILIFFVH